MFVVHLQPCVVASLMHRLDGCVCAVVRHMHTHTHATQKYRIPLERLCPNVRCCRRRDGLLCQMWRFSNRTDRDRCLLGGWCGLDQAVARAKLTQTHDSLGTRTQNHCFSFTDRDNLDFIYLNNLDRSCSLPTKIQFNRMLAPVPYMIL